VALNILWTGSKLIAHAMRGLMDHALSEDEESQVIAVLSGIAAERPGGEVEFHAIQSRESGRERFVSMHVLVPGEWSVTAGHDLLEQVEESIRAVLPGAHVQTHIEPREDPRSYGDAASGKSVQRDT